MLKIDEATPAGTEATPKSKQTQDEYIVKSNSSQEKNSITGGVSWIPH